LNDHYRKLYDQTKLPVGEVHITSRAIMNIIRHCGSSNSLVAGQLLGLEFNGVLEITYSFPFPSDQDDSEYQLDMMKYLRDINVDSNNVGWYLSSYNGNHIGVDLFESQLSYQSDIKNSVVVIYDPMITEEGNLSIRAYRLNEKMIKLLKNKDFTKLTLIENHFSFEDFLEEIPVKLSDSSLSTSMLMTLNDQITPFEDVQLSDNSFLQKNIEGLVQSINELFKENTNFVNWQKNLAKQEQLQQQYITKRKQELETSKKKGQQTTEMTQQDFENSNPKLFKRPPEPDRMESLLLDYQINYYCTQINDYVGNKPH